jgi:hypothetical protein
MTTIARIMVTHVAFLRRILLGRALVVITLLVPISETVVVTFRIGVSLCVLVVRISVGVIRPIPIVVVIVAPRRSVAVTEKKLQCYN